jgi:hypothetical protein
MIKPIDNLWYKISDKIIHSANDDQNHTYVRMGILMFILTFWWFIGVIFLSLKIIHDDGVWNNANI